MTEYNMTLGWLVNGDTETVTVRRQGEQVEMTTRNVWGESTAIIPKDAVRVLCDLLIRSTWDPPITDKEPF